MGSRTFRTGRPGLQMIMTRNKIGCSGACFAPMIAAEGIAIIGHIEEYSR